MRLVIDANVLVSALLSSASPPAQLIDFWREGSFELVTSVQQANELERVLRYPKISKRLDPALAERLLHELLAVATVVENLPTVAVSADPYDNYLLATAQAGAADFLVTGDKRDLLTLGRHHGTAIVSVRDFLNLTRRLP